MLIAVRDVGGLRSEVWNQEPGYLTKKTQNKWMLLHCWYFFILTHMWRTPIKQTLASCFLPLWLHSLFLMWFVISLRRPVTGGATTKVNNIREGRLPPAESPSGRFLWRVDHSVGEPVHSSEHPSSTLTHSGTHRPPQQGINTNNFPWSRNEESDFTVWLKEACVYVFFVRKRCRSLF